MKQQQSIKYEEGKTRLVKQVCGKRSMKRKGIGGREVTKSFCGKIIKMASQRKNERDLTIYTEQILYLRREVRNVGDMMEFNWASIV